MKLLDFFPGYKTYMLAAAEIFHLLFQLFQGDITIGDSIDKFIVAFMAITLRKGIKSVATDK